MIPNFNEEKKLWAQGFNFVVGLDEAGRGPLAGPVVAGAVLFKKNQSSILDFEKSRASKILKSIKDSKQLSEKERDGIYGVLVNHPDIEWGVGIVSEKVIDKINILQASKLAMAKALKNLKSKNKGLHVSHLILDGNFKIKSELPQKSVIKGDCRVFSCAAASIIAKVTRDRIMLEYHTKYPNYGFDRHKGYCTKLHIEKICEFGPCKIHRKSFSCPQPEVGG